MTFWLTITAALLLFLAGVRLSAFFSGSETGFYRISFLRLSIDAHAGDKVAKRLIWFVHNPEFFVATTLVGNNIANYLTTLAIGLCGDSVIDSDSAFVEIGLTLLVSPVIFVFGEVMPKNLYFRAPTTLLRKGLHEFRFWYRLLLVMSTPLVWITRLIERFSSSQPQNMELVLGRHRLTHVLSKGHEHGLLTSEQGQLIHGLLHEASNPAAEMMIPPPRIIGVEESVDRETLLQSAREYGLTQMPVSHDGGEDWFGYVRMLDVELSTQSWTDSIRPLPRIAHNASRLAALMQLRESADTLGLVCEGDDIRGLLTERALIEHFMHPTGSPHSRHVPLSTRATPV